MKKSKNYILIAILVIVAFLGFVFIVGSDNDIDVENSTTQTISFSDISITTTNSESTTEVSTEESSTLPETTTEGNTTEQETTTQKSETTTKKKETTTKKKETTTKKTETTTKRTETTTKKTETTTKKSKITYVLNTSTMKFHKPSCWCVDKIEDENYDTYKGNRDEVIEIGYSPCGHCDP